VNNIQSKSTSAHQFPAIDALRGLAAMAVVLFHLRGFLRVPMAGPLAFFGESGWMGVDLFSRLMAWLLASRYCAICAQVFLRSMDVLD
jgi:peptidoglycan/LPS O-acetylase OafA/YrhL